MPFSHNKYMYLFLANVVLCVVNQIENKHNTCFENPKSFTEKNFDSINEILNAVSEINEVKVNTQIKSKKRVDNNDIPKNTLKLIEKAEKSKG